jgi:hypothetical protein
MVVSPFAAHHSFFDLSCGCLFSVSEVTALNDSRLRIALCYGLGRFDHAALIGGVLVAMLHNVSSFFRILKKKSHKYGFPAFVALISMDIGSLIVI